MRSFLFLFLFSALLFTASCTDPASDVGLNLLGDETNLQVETVYSSSFLTSTSVDITGSAPRVLVGSVDDPLTGQISTNGFLGFTGTFAGSPAESINSAQLRLSRNYNFGDTTKAVEFSLHQITEEWDQIGLQSDTDLNIGPAILTVTSQDTLTTVNLPASWISENETVLRSSEFESEFYGFALIGSSNNRVVGFNATRITLELTSSSGSTIYTVGSTYTQVKRMRSSTSPEGLILFQDGAGPTIEMNFNLDEFKNTPINSATLSFSADPHTSQVAPANFIRPPPQTLHLVALSSDDTTPPVLVGQAEINDNGEYHFSGIEVSIFFQRILFGSQEYEHFELRSPVENHSLNAILLHGINSGDLSPRITIILSP